MEILALEGVIERVLYRNQQNGYTVLYLDCGEEIGVIPMTGSLPPVGAGERLSVSGAYVNHAQYGRQFKIDSAEVLPPQNKASLARYLSSGFIHGLGPVTAERIVERFGMDTLEIIEHTPERLREVKGISPMKAKEIAAAYKSQANIRDLTAFLQEYGIEPIVAIRLYARFGPFAATSVKENPYIMANEFFGLGFVEVDRVASAFGHPSDYDRRIEAGVAYVLTHNLNEGHVFLPRRQLVPRAAEMLDLPQDSIEDAVDMMIETGDIVPCMIAGFEACYLSYMFECEQYIAQRVTELSQIVSPLAYSPAELAARADENIEYSSLQLSAIEEASRQGIMILTGGPGTGKTTTVKGMISLFERIGQAVMLAAPTGRAAKRLSELSGREAKTVHRLLEADLDRETGLSLFARSEENPLDADILILDEASMVDLPLMANLLRAMRPECRLILVGDADQLPPVGPGSVLRDLVRSDMVCSVVLTEIFRQASQSAIVMGAHAVNRGEMPDLNLRDRDMFFLSRRSQAETLETVVELCLSRLPGKMGIPFSDIQVLSPTRKTEAGTDSLNLALQQALNPSDGVKAELRSRSFTFREGDRIMQIRNNYELFWSKADGELGKGVFNGDMGIITAIDPAARLIYAMMDERMVTYTQDMLDEIEPAYAITVHKSQGSEFRAVVICLSLRSSRLLNRNLLYTAITRARELLIVVGSEATMRAMVENNRSTRRFTGLRLRLLGEV